MIKAYIIPQLNAIKIDNEISLRLTTLETPTEPGTNPGGGGASNGGNNEWDRGGLNNQDPFGSGIWNNQIN